MNFIKGLAIASALFFVASVTHGDEIKPDKHGVYHPQSQQELATLEAKKFECIRHNGDWNCEP